MSTAHDDAHAFDSEPASTLPADEPLTPGWLSATGLALFLAGGVYFMATAEPSPAAAHDAEDAKPVAAAPAAVTPPPAASARRGTAPLDPAAAAAAKANFEGTQRSPEQVKELQKRIEELRKKRAGQGVVPGPGAVPAPPAPAPAPAH